MNKKFVYQFGNNKKSYTMMHGQPNIKCWVQFSQITPVLRINHELCLDGFTKLVPPLALCSHVLDLPV